jgi:hypothetical protein
MKGNRHSPFFAETTTNADILEFIGREINVEKEKRKLRGCLFIKATEVEQMPHEVILAAARHLGIVLSAFSVAAISQATNKLRLREIQHELTKNSTGHDGSLLLHINHISDDDYYDQKTRELVLSNFGDQLDHEGYLKQQS